MEPLTLQFDGGSRGNPGPAGIGVVIRAEDGTPVVTIGRYIGKATNNVAEYSALVAGLQELKKLGATHIHIKGDSELVIKQLKREYKVKHPDLKILYADATDLMDGFKVLSIQHTYREKNSLADALANKAMDKKAEVLDVDDPGTPVAITPATVPNLRRHCARCGAIITIDKFPNLPPSELKPFRCACGEEMKK